MLQEEPKLPINVPKTIVSQRQTKTTNENLFTNLSSSDTAATVTIDGNTLRPAPFVSINVEKYYSGDIIIGGKWVVSLSGTVYGENFGDTISNVNSILSLISNTNECVPIIIECGGNKLINGYGKIVGGNIDQGDQSSWINVAPYSITIDVYINEDQAVVTPSDQLSSYNISNALISSLNENFTLNYNEESSKGDLINGSNIHGTRAHVKLDFDINITGMPVCVGISSLKGGLEAAEQVIVARIQDLKRGIFPNSLGTPNLSGEISAYTSGSTFINLRNVNVNPINGTISVNGSAIYRPQNCSHPDSLIQVNVETQNNGEDPTIKTVTISGTIEGLSSDDFNNIIDHSSFPSAVSNRIGVAQSAWSEIHSAANDIALAHQDVDANIACHSGLGNLCDTAVDKVCDEFSINSSQRTHNYHDGTISFTIVCSNKRHCNLPGFIYYNVDVAEDYGHQQIVPHTIIGRGYPIIQNLNCTTARTKTVTVSGRLDSCGINDRDALQNCVETACTTYGEPTWYVTQNTFNYSPTGSSFTCTKQYTLPSC